MLFEKPLNLLYNQTRMFYPVIYVRRVKGRAQKEQNTHKEILEKFDNLNK